MIDRAHLATDLIGYLTFDIHSHLATLVVCGRGGRGARTIMLEPAGRLVGILLRLGILLGRFRDVRRAIAYDDCDRRIFSVWIGTDRRVIVSDESGEHWLCSVNERSARRRARTVVVPNPEIITVVRHRGIGDASLN